MMSIFVVSVLVTYWYVRRARHEARQTATLGLAARRDEAIISILGPPPAEGVEANPNVLVEDRAALNEEFQALNGELAAYWWWWMIPVLLPILFFIECRAAIQLWLVIGYPPGDAILLGVMLAILMVAASRALVWAWTTTYDGTRKRSRRIITATLVYAVLVACMVGLRLGFGDPTEPWYVRASSCGLIVAATVGPALAIEDLGRRLFALAPKLYRRRYLERTLRGDDRESRDHRRASAHQVQRAILWHKRASKLGYEYDTTYEKTIALLRREQPE